MYIYVYAYTGAYSIFQWVGGNKNICYKKDRRLSSLEPHHFVDGSESRPQAFGRVVSCPNHICQKHASDKCDDVRAWKHSQRLDIIKQCQADRPLAPSKLWCAPDAFSILQHFVLYLMPANKDGGLRTRLFSANIPQESGHGLLDQKRLFSGGSTARNPTTVRYLEPESVCPAASGVEDCHAVNPQPGGYKMRCPSEIYYNMVGFCAWFP